jgi:prophage antirepressor-like protein
MKSDILPYLFDETLVRVVMNNGDPRFVISDVCKSIDISNSRDAVTRLHPDDVGSADIIDSMGRVQTVNVCNESGLYMLIFQSRKAAAKKFTRWVTSEVLPAIRKTGSYAALGLYERHQLQFMSLVQDQIDLGVSPETAAKCAQRLCPPPLATFRTPSSAHTVLSEMEDVLSRMETGKKYSITDLAALLPEDHPLVHERSAASIHSALGKLMERARKMEKVERIRGRTINYRLLASIIPIAEGRP